MAAIVCKQTASFSLGRRPPFPTHRGFLQAANFSVRASLQCGNTGYPPRNKAIAKADTSNIIEVKKKNIKQSPLKMKFLVMLVRRAWVPDAFAQLKFSPKHRAEDLTAMLKRGCALAKLNHGFIPEELIVREVLVTKGLARKQMTMMGRGRTGYGYNRCSHITLKLDHVNFDAMMEGAKTPGEAAAWANRKLLVAELKSKQSTAAATAAATASAV